MEGIGKVAYMLALPPPLDEIHNMFYVSKLKKYVLDSSHVIDYTPSQFKKDLICQEQSMWIVVNVKAWYYTLYQNSVA